MNLIKGRTLTTSIFGCPNALKWVTLLQRAWFKDEKNGMVCHDWMHRSRDIYIFRLKYGNICHIWNNIFFNLNIFENGLICCKVLIEYFQKMYRFNIIGHTVDKINAFEMFKKCYFFAESALFLHLKMQISCERFIQSWQTNHFFHP